MAPKKQSRRTSRRRHKLERDRVGDLFADIPDETGEGKVRISFRRNWYSPPFTNEGEIDYARASEELSRELTGGTLVVRRYLETGDLGYSTDIPVASKEELEHILRTMRKLFVEGLKHDNAVRKSGLEACHARIAELARPAPHHPDRRKIGERRTRNRRGRQLLGSAWFRRNDRRTEPERRTGIERRVA
jgi:hypothetical protein